MYTHKHTHTQIYTHLHTHLHTQTHTLTHIHTHPYTHNHTNKHSHTHIHTLTLTGAKRPHAGDDVGLATKYANEDWADLIREGERRLMKKTIPDLKVRFVCICVCVCLRERERERERCLGPILWY